MPPADSRRRALGIAAFVGTAFLSLALRLPALANAEYTFTADEAVDALVMRRLALAGEMTLFNWDTRYYGIVEGLLALPWVALLGWQPLAFKLGALSGLALLALGVYCLGRRLWSPWTGAVAALWLLFVSPQFALYWTLLAAGGYALVVAWGVAALFLLARWIAPGPAPPRRWAAFGLLLGSGVYVYQLFLVFVGVVLAWLAVAIWRRRTDLGRGLPALALGFALGWSPQAIALVAGPPAGRSPAVAFGSLAETLADIRLLATDCGPALLGAAESDGRPLPGAWRWLGIVAACLPLLALLVAVGRHRFSRWDTRALLWLLVPLDVALVCLTGLPQDVNSSRYLLPALPALALALGWAVSALGERRRIARWVLAALVVAPAAALVARAVTVSRFVEAGRIQRLREPLRDVIEHLEARGIDAAYAPYWVAYKATFLSAERVIFDATDWSRFPPYAEHADRAARAAWVFAIDPPAMDAIRRRQATEALARFERRLRLGGIAAERVDLGPYRIFSAPGGGRLLPAPVRERPRPLLRPAARIELTGSPSTVRPNEPFVVAARITNTSDGPWSVEGDPNRSGSWQVNAAYRWFDDGGRLVTEYGERSPLPHDLRPGESVSTTVEITAPAEAGAGTLRITLVQEDVAWFDGATGSLAERHVTVAP